MHSCLNPDTEVIPSSNPEADYMDLNRPISNGNNFTQHYIYIPYVPKKYSKFYNFFFFFRYHFRLPEPPQLQPSIYK